MNITCLFPECEEQLQPHDLEDHIRCHLHLKLHRCFCEKRFYTLASLDAHLQTSADDETHCSMNVYLGDVYLKALVSRIAADFKDAQNGAPIPIIASNLRQRTHALASRSASVTPAKTVGEKRPTLEAEKEVVPQKVHCSSQMEDLSEDLTILVPSRSTSKSPIRPIEKPSERERNFSESSQRKEDHTLATHEQSSASTTRTLHEAVMSDVIGKPMLPIEKMTLPPELSNLGDSARQKLPSLLTVELSERQAQVASTHVPSNQRDRRDTREYRPKFEYYRQELAYLIPRRSSLHSDLRPTGSHEGRSSSNGAFRNFHTTEHRKDRDRQQQGRPNHNRDRRGNRP